MNVATKLGGYTVVLAVLAAGAWFTGSAAGPVRSGPEPAAHAGMGGAAERSPVSSAAAVGTHGSHGESDLPVGLTAAQSGYTMVPLTTVLNPARAQTFAFRIVSPDGAPVTRYEIEHEKRLHLIVVRRDTAGFQHVHPELGTDGTWRAALDTRLPGNYRAFADFVPDGADPLTLEVDFATPGDFRPIEHRNSTQATVDGYQVRLTGRLSPGRTATLTLNVYRNGKPVDDLQPYLGAYGHLVALRGGDLGYLHVHPDGEPGDGITRPGPGITFFAEAPSAGSYRLFLDFKHGDKVRTAEFTVTAGTSGAPAPEHAGPAHGHGDDQPHG